MRDMFVAKGLPVPDWPFAETALAQAGEARLEELLAWDHPARCARRPESRFSR
ncbi:hypothetical protein SCYAM73S_04077 [Streptomyces cyaneofuscatus]